MPIDSYMTRHSPGKAMFPLVYTHIATLQYNIMQGQHTAGVYICSSIIGTRCCQSKHGPTGGAKQKMGLKKLNIMERG